MKIRHLCVMPLLLAAATTAHANLLINGSLETSARINGRGRVLTPTEVANALGSAWTVTQGTVDLLPRTYWQSSKGNYSVDMIGSPGLGGISQTVNGLTIGAEYILTFDFSINPDIRERGSTKILQVQAIGNTVLADETFSRTRTNETRLNMRFTHESILFTADSTSVTIVLAALAPLNLPAGVTPSTSVVGPVVDNLVLELSDGGSGPNVPEPASLGVMGAGSLLLLRRRRK
jgi:hypothetical protein